MEGILCILDWMMGWPLQLCLKTRNNTPQEWGLKINQWNHCGVNKIINWMQCPIIWHVDDLKVSHAEKDIVEDILKQLMTTYHEQRKSIRLSGNDARLPQKRKIEFLYARIYKWTNRWIATWHGWYCKKTPAANHLFNLNDNKKN